MPPAMTPIAAELFRIVIMFDGWKNDRPVVVNSTAMARIRMARSAPDQSALKNRTSKTTAVSISERG